MFRGIWRLGVIATAGMLILAACGAQPVTMSPNSSVQVTSDDATATALANAVSSLFQGTAAALANPPTPVAIPTSDLANDPAYAAQQWYTAVANSDGNTIGRYTCAAQQTSSSQEGAFLTIAFGSFNSLLSQFLPGIKMQIDLSGLQYRTVSNDGFEATVSIYGDVSAAIGGAFKSGKLDATAKLTHENGQWKVCGWS